MGQLVRENTAPIANGEIADGDEIEAEINKIVVEINGRLDNSNLRSDANIAGSKLADTSVAGSKLQADTVTTAKMAAAAVPKGYVATSTATATLTGGTTFVDVESITAATMTPGSTGDLIFCDFTFSIQDEGGGGFTNYDFAFSVNGTEGPVVARYPNHDVGEHPWLSGSHSWAIVAPATTSMVIKPIYKRAAAGAGNARWGLGAATADFLTKIFRVQIIPTK